MEPITLQKGVALALRSVLLIGATISLLRFQWLEAALIAGIFILTLVPARVGRGLGINFPPEFEILAIAFVFASLFLGEVHGYYVHYWWWDAVLHTTSGFLLGLFGFTLVFVLNQSDRVPFQLSPAFVCLFAFCFALALGTLWEVFEFAMDQWFGLNMQKSGLVDTMGDLIVDTAGALVVSLMGYAYLRYDRESFVITWLRSFVEHNPRLFRRDRAA